MLLLIDHFISYSTVVEVYLTSCPLESFTNNKSIYYGIKTGCNEAFIIDNETKEALVRNDPKSSEILRPVLRGRDIGRYCADWETSQLWLISTIPAMNVNIDTYKAVKHYLESFGKKRLEQNGVILSDGTKSRKKTPHCWYELQDTCAYYEEFWKQKIAWPDISSKPNFCLSEAGVLLNNTAYILTGRDIEYLLGVLNSTVTNFIFPKIASSLGDKGTRYFKEFVNFLPIPCPTLKNQSMIAQITELVRNINRKDHSPRIGRHQYSPDIDKEIEMLIFELYDFTIKEQTLLFNTYRVGHGN